MVQGFCNIIAIFHLICFLSVEIYLDYLQVKTSHILDHRRFWMYKDFRHAYSDTELHDRFPN